MCGFISGLIAKVGRVARGGGGVSRALKTRNRRANGVDTRRLRQCLQELSPPALQPRCKDLTRLDPLHLEQARAIEVPGLFYSVPGKAWLSSAELTATSLPCHEIVMAWFCGASSRLSLMPLGCILAMTHFSASTLLQLRKKPSVIIKCRKK